jgi:hypothetical protein
MSGLFETLSGAKGLRAEGRSAQNIANYNALVAEQEAEAQRKKAAFGQKRLVKKGEEIKSALTAKLAKGGGLGSLVAGDLAAEQAAEIELERLLIEFEGETAGRRAESQAELDRLQGRLARQKGKNAARRANIQFGTQLALLGTTFLSGFGGGGTTTGRTATGTTFTGSDLFSRHIGR